MARRLERPTIQQFTSGIDETALLKRYSLAESSSAFSDLLST
jgi:hypothetical protein